jgi:hypothetical protein
MEQALLLVLNFVDLARLHSLKRLCRSPRREG